MCRARHVLAAGRPVGYDRPMPSEHDDRAAEDVQRAAHPPAADQIDQREHAAQPPQVDEGFAEGQEIKPDTPEEERVRDFAEGQEVVPHEDVGRFSEGQEIEPETPEKVVERRFSEGQEIAPDSE
jgi:hypothetical protein